MIQQKKLRKTIPLTESQSRRLHELSEFDGLDPLEHSMRAIDEYLRKQNIDIQPPKENEIQAELKNLTAESSTSGAFWISGTVDKYEFSALFLKLPSKSGIDKGKVSKLSIWDPQVLEDSKSFIGACIVNYDRGWDIKPSKIAEPLYNKVKVLLDSSGEQYIKKRRLR
ncbi:DUF7678 domain-containing protein [Dyadobacter psychrotolerans]|uniref:DUF7678 domain-containing protein n=1 Tax=Dyadobacter psychrotolerans TaxID=2541721 RepID=A0A4R5DW62_9BACT|nr:hypothetical protein [Dyadobacter psychrotolerans]TDE15263.1 hypothetical protein E0F88_12125 [Dyadobacter psychrotolerans]